LRPSPGRDHTNSLFHLPITRLIPCDRVCTAGFQMRKNISNRGMPAIIVSNTDRDQLRRLAVSAMDRMPEVANELLTEIERATIVASPAVPRNVIQMGSTAEIVAGGDGRRRVTLVFPSDADISSGKISILTPIGAALNTRRPGAADDCLGCRADDRRRLAPGGAAPSHGRSDAQCGPWNSSLRFFGSLRHSVEQVADRSILASHVATRQ
jgi:regulator of nucleoside diphosphate kinase